MIDIEPRLSGWLDKMRMLVITDRGGFSPNHHLEIARAALRGGCRAIQLRDKQMDESDFARLAERLKRECRTAEALFFVNDRVEVAVEVEADGLHLGVSDCEVATARDMLGKQAVIGFSPESPKQAEKAVRAGCDYLGVGPVFSTSSKPDAGEPIGLEGLSRYSSLGVAPVIAVGGIDATNAGSTLRAGAVGVAVLSAVCSAGDVEESVRSILSSMENQDAGGNS